MESSWAESVTVPVAQCRCEDSIRQRSQRAWHAENTHSVMMWMTDEDREMRLEWSLGAKSQGSAYHPKES